MSRILSTGGGGCLPQCILGYPPRADTPSGADTPRSRHPPGSRHPPREQTLPGSRHPPGADPLGADTPLEADCSIQSTSGRYASYWNAFLFFVNCILLSSSNLTKFMKKSTEAFISVYAFVDTFFGLLLEDLPVLLPQYFDHKITPHRKYYID